MRIAIVTTQFPVLSETFISNKVKALGEKGHTVRVFTGKKNKALLQEKFSALTNVSVVEFTIKNAVTYSLTNPLSFLKGITSKNKKSNLFNSYRLHHINKFKPDIIHFEFSGVGVDYFNLLTKINCKKVVSCRGSAEKVKLLANPERKKVFAKLMQSVDAVHCVSADMRNTIQSYVDASKTFINYPSIDADFFNRTTPYQTNATPVIISIGRFIFPKNYLIGLLALRRVADAGINFKWIVVAAGPQQEEIIFHIQQLQLQHYVELAGTKSSAEIKDLLESADIFLLSSVYEGVANAALEAMSMQLPVVSTTCGGMPEVITCGTNGLLAGVYDYEKLAQHIIFLIQNPPAAKVMGMAARERVLETFTLQQQTAQFEHLYQQLLTT